MELITAFPKPTTDLNKVVTTVPDVTTIIPEPTNPNFKSFIKEVFNSPKKSTIFLLGLSLVISLLLFGVFIVNQNFNANKQLEIQDQKYSENLKNKEESNKKVLATVKQNQDKTRKNDLVQIKSALKNYKTDNGYHPATLEDLVPGYLATIPLDPETNGQYYFLSSLDQETFILRAILSDGKEIELDNN